MRLPRASGECELGRQGRTPENLPVRIDLRRHPALTDDPQAPVHQRPAARGVRRHGQRHTERLFDVLVGRDARRRRREAAGQQRQKYQNSEQSASHEPPCTTLIRVHPSRGARTATDSVTERRAVPCTRGRTVHSRDDAPEDDASEDDAPEVVRPLRSAPARVQGSAAAPHRRETCRKGGSLSGSSAGRTTSSPPTAPRRTRTAPAGPYVLSRGPG